MRTSLYSTLFSPTAELSTLHTLWHRGSFPVENTPRSFDLIEGWSQPERPTRAFSINAKDVNELCDLQPGLQPFGCRYVLTVLNSTFYQHPASRYLQRLPYLYNRSLLKMLRKQTRRYRSPGDAVLHIVGCPYTFTAEVADHEYQSTSSSLRTIEQRIVRGRRVSSQSPLPDPSCAQTNQDLDLQRHSTICELTFPTTVLAVRMNRKRLVVVLEDQIYLYDISNMKLLYTLETSPNPNGTVLMVSP